VAVLKSVAGWLKIKKWVEVKKIKLPKPFFIIFLPLIQTKGVDIT